MMRSLTFFGLLRMSGNLELRIEIWHALSLPRCDGKGPGLRVKKSYIQVPALSLDSCAMGLCEL